MRFWLLFLAGAASACAQPFSFGVKAGVPLDDFFDAVHSDGLGYFSSNNPYIVGPTVELKLPFGLGIEFDALYRHLHYWSVEDTAGTISATTTSGDWELPLLAKYHFHGPLVRPYVDGGIAWDVLSGVSQTLFQVSGPSTTSSPMELEHSTVRGFVLGGGIDIHVLLVHVLPEIRYTYWGSPHFQFQSITGAGSIQSTQNQFEFLVGITF
jgi:hypothetical protein